VSPGGGDGALHCSAVPLVDRISRARASCANCR